MSEAHGDPLRKPPAPSGEASASNGDDDAVNLLDDAVEPTDDSPTVISKTVQPQGGVRIEDAGGGLRGRRLAHFELIEPIGVGGMAAVLRARDTQLDRLVALKILPPEMAADPENVRRFHQEARSAAKLDHENIARVFFCGEDQRLHFIAFEFVEGDNLRAILEKRGRVPVGEALHYMLQVAAGLAHAARRGVVHRDIKPSNIIVTPNGRAKLVDMGLARSLEPQHDMGLTQSGVTLGTFDYISPEQALEPRDADVRSDIYSLGCTFYHMLTGQPPVPEGTAAKKLHHHQHIKPTDPRQFVPDLPDEAAIILDRMMAKQPKDRYQTPEHLVHHLYLAARKLGAAAEVPEGVLAVEAALPAPPAGRPLVLAAAAVLAVVALIFLVDSSSSTKPEPPPSLVLAPLPPKDNSDAAPPQNGVASVAEQGTKEKPVAAEEKKPEAPIFDEAQPTVEALAKFLRANEKADKIVLALDDLDLSRRDDKTPDLVIANRVLEIRPRTPGKRPTLRDQYHARLSQPFQPSLTIRSEICEIRNIRFMLNQNGCRVPMALLWFDGTREVTLSGCEFIQVYPWDEKPARMASVLVEAREGKPASLSASNSCFLGFVSLDASTEYGPSSPPVLFDKAGGQDAITRRGPVRLDLRDCLFGPHAAAFRLEGRADADAPVQLNHCSVMTAPSSAVFDVADAADAHIHASFSLFSQPEDAKASEWTDGNDAVLVRRASTQGQVAYRGRDNRYHRLGSLLTVADVPEKTLLALLDDLKRHDPDSRPVETSPWKNADPLKQLKLLAIQTAFAVDPFSLDLRGPNRQSELLGAQEGPTFSYRNAKLPDLKADAASAGRERIVQDRKMTDSKNRLYPSLTHALADVQPGEVVRLQLNGEVKLDPYQLNGKNVADLTIRADAGFHPILTLNADNPAAVSALFEICNGKLQLEGLEIRLRPRGDDEWCAVVSFLGDGECAMKNCAITLERSATARATVALLPRRTMKKATTKQPQLRLENCFVRGYGDLVKVQGASCAKVEIDKSLIALSGSLLNIESDKNDERAAGDPLELRMQNVTTYLGENVVRLHAAKSVKTLAKVQCLSSACLFLPAGDRGALVRLEGSESEEVGLRDKLLWESTAKNAYGTFPALLEMQSLDSMKMPNALNQEKWKGENSGEANNEYNVNLPNPPAADLLFSQLASAAFRPSDALQKYGVDPRSLPTPQGKKVEAPARAVDLSEEDLE